MYYHISRSNMVKIQLDLSDDEDNIVEIYKLVHKLNTKQDAIKKMVRHFKAKVVPERMDDDYFKS